MEDVVLESGELEFVRENEVVTLLREHGITSTPDGEDRIHLVMASTEPVRLHLSTATAETEPAAGATVVTMDRDRLPAAIEGVIHKLHLNQVVLVPVGRWRHLFDAVAFSLADNEDWQAVDAAATVELNTRDPLLCEPVDFHTVSAMMRALLTDGDRPEQGVALLATAAPVLVEVVPDGAVRMSFGSQVLADEAIEAIEALKA